MATIPTAPPAFAAAAEALRTSLFRDELSVREIAAPERIAPNAIALSANVRPGVGSMRPIDESDEEPADSAHGAGRIVLLHDPASADEWGAPFRIVCYAQAPLEVELGVDPFIADVAWSWLVDALDSRGAQYAYVSGTVTKSVSTGFGTLESQGDGAQIQLRASWTPIGDDFAAHAAAWSELLCLLAGLPHHQEGVASLGAQRLQRRAEQTGGSPRG
ncbi:DUF3000 domain-containing protein [Leucobacter sp. GX24907]